MPVVDRLLELEAAKHQALLDCDAQSYEDLVGAQDRLLNGAHVLAESARDSSSQWILLARLIRLNTALLLNFMTTSPLVVLRTAKYTSSGLIDAQAASRFSVEV